MLRTLALFALVALAAASAAQPAYYNSLDRRQPAEAERATPGVRVGLGVGPSVYVGPDLLYGDAVFQSDVVSTRLGAMAEVTAPLLGSRLYGRLAGGLLNLGAAADRADVSPAGANPFLTGPVGLVEGTVLYYLAAPGGPLAPYAFTGLGGLFATRGALPDVGTAALALPVGVGVEVGVSRNVAVFGEAGYRIGLTAVGEEATALSFAAAALATAHADGATDCDDTADKKDPTCTGAPPPSCEEDPTREGCGEVIGEGDSAFDRRISTALVLGGVRIGFGRSPERAVVPAPQPLPAPPPAPAPAPAPAVCELVELNAVTFASGSDRLDRRARSLLDENVELLLDSVCCVFVDGYTDRAEAEASGLRLAERRALAVVDYYASRGVGPERLEPRTLGRALPSCDKEDPGPGCERNRRVESLPLDCDQFRSILEGADGPR